MDFHALTMSSDRDAVKTDEVPDFGTGSILDKAFAVGSAIAEFQTPAAAGGNGVIPYAASGLPTDSRFYVTAIDSPSCASNRARVACGTAIVAAAGIRSLRAGAAARSNLEATASRREMHDDEWRRADALKAQGLLSEQDWAARRNGYRTAQEAENSRAAPRRTLPLRATQGRA